MSHQYLDGRETVTWSNLVEGTTTHFGTADDNAIIGLPGKCRLHAVVVSAASADQAAGVMDVRVRAGQHSLGGIAERRDEHHGYRYQ